MAGDSDDDLLSGEDEEDDPSRVTSQELLNLRRLERQRQLAQQAAAAPLEEEDERQQDIESHLSFSPPPMPPWPTPRSINAPNAPAGHVSFSEVEKTAPLSGAPQPMASLPPTVPAGPARGNTAPFARPQQGDLSAAALPQTAARRGFLPGWRGFRRHSYWLIPLLLVVAFFLLVVVTRFRQPGAMLFIFAAIGVLQAAILLYAPNDAFWAVGVVGGFLVFLSVAFFAVFLPIFALILSILLLSLGGVALRERYYPVREGTVAVMGLFGRYNRTLQPGFNLRVPGEKELGVVETQRIRHEARIPPVTLFSGEQVTLSVAMVYQVVPGEEHLAIRQTKEWQKPIQQQLQAVVQDVVSALSLDDFRQLTGFHPAGVFSSFTADEIDNDQGASPLDRINEHLTSAMREQVADRGVAVHAVKIHRVDSPHQPGVAHAAGLQPPPAHPPLALPPVVQHAGQVVESIMPGAPSANPPAYLAPPAGPPGQPVAPARLPGPPGAQPPGGAGVSPPGAPPQPMTLLSAQALAETYDAVVHQRITDLATIRRIISQFEAVAADPELSQQVPFDAEAGAQNLITHLRNLQARSYSPSAQPPDAGGFAPDAAGPLPEED